MLRYLKIAYEYFALYSSLTLLGLICLAWSVVALPLYVILPRGLGTRVGRYGIMCGFRIYAWSLTVTRTYRLDLRAIDSLRGAPSMILAPNHPALIDALLILTRHPNIVCVMKAELMRNVFLGAGSRLARYVPNEHPRQMVVHGDDVGAVDRVAGNVIIGRFAGLVVVAPGVAGIQPSHGQALLAQQFLAKSARIDA